MNQNTSAPQFVRALATGFALAMLILSADAVVCVGSDGHLAIERVWATCCGVGVPDAGPSASSPDDCVGCVDAELASALAATTAPRSDVASLSTALAAVHPPAPRANLAAGPVAPALVHRRPASLEFARVISLRC